MFQLHRPSPISFSSDSPVEARQVRTAAQQRDEVALEQIPNPFAFLQQERIEEVVVEEVVNPHQRFHTIPMEEVPFSDEGVRVFDSGPVFHDRFTVCFPDGTIYTMSSNPLSAYGVLEYAGKNGQVPKDQEILMEDLCPNKSRFEKMRIDPPVQVDIVPIEVAEAVCRLMSA